MPKPPPKVRRILTRPGRGTYLNIADSLRGATMGGALLAGATVIAIVLANSPAASWYAEVSGTAIGPASLHLNLTIAEWAQDGLLTVFFFVVGLELKREFTSGDLRSPAKAVIPIVAAIGGMAAPAAIYLAINASSPSGASSGWAIPSATDIAFALAVLALVSSHLPTALRAFLLTLAVVDDLLGIVIIAVAYSSRIHVQWLAACLATVAVFGVLVRRRITSPWLLLPLAALAWAFLHISGIHATIAGVLLAFTVPAVARPGEGGADEESLAERFEHRWRPISTGFAVPVFALFAAGVTVDPAALHRAVTDPAAIGVAAGLVIGKPVGILLATFLIARFSRAELDEGLSWWDILAVGLVAGIGFTVALLISDLAFGTGDPERTDSVKIAILAGSAIAAALGATALAIRNRRYRAAGAPRTM